MNHNFENTIFFVKISSKLSFVLPEIFVMKVIGCALKLQTEKFNVDINKQKKNVKLLLLFVMAVMLPGLCWP